MLARNLRPVCGTSGPKGRGPFALQYLVDVNGYSMFPKVYRHPIHHCFSTSDDSTKRYFTTPPKKPSTDFEPAAQSKLFDFFRQLAADAQERETGKLEVPSFDSHISHDKSDSDAAVREEKVRPRRHEGQPHNLYGMESLAPRPEPRFGIDVKEDSLRLGLDNIKRLADTSLDNNETLSGELAVQCLRESMHTSNERKQTKGKIRGWPSFLRKGEMTVEPESAPVGFVGGLTEKQGKRKLALPTMISSFFVRKANRQSKEASHGSFEFIPKDQVISNPACEAPSTRQLPDEATSRNVLLSDTRFWQQTGLRLAGEQRVSTKSWRLATERLLPTEWKLYRAWKRQIYNPTHGINSAVSPSPSGDNQIKIDLPPFNWDEYVIPVKRTPRSIRRHKNRAAAMNVVFQHNEAVPENASWLWKHMPHLKPLIRVMIKVMELEKQIRRDLRNRQTWHPMPSEVVPIRRGRERKNFSRRTLRR
ncbi:uncharacterized protein BDW70DRAFT_170768 [Aspergillus foveolatus]|uniref:uncharacterized protein n=1 Tax=Aspergillus foveolatus TaxID=210207 RepID=UPI003CCE434E